MLTLEDRATAAREEAIATAIAFPMDAIVERYADEQGLPPRVAREHERELKRFLALCALDPAAPYGMNGPVDELWHTFITFTRDYARFCEDVAGHFIHHVPRVPGAEGQAEEVDGYALMLADYEATFGEAPPPEVWPRRAGAPTGSACLQAPSGSSCLRAPSGSSCLRAPSGSACIPAPSGSACIPAPSGSACSPVAPTGSACSPLRPSDV